MSSSGYVEKPGQWWLYSFVPERSANAVVLGQPKLAAGLSVDLAWQSTRGDAAVTLAFLDDGIDWTDPDLDDAIFLNVGELSHFPLTFADGTACAPLAGSESPRVDCSRPPDGILSVSDYREILGWVDGKVGLDPNQNGVLDPEDIVLSYSDGIDNDRNGFVDDIAGWDFVDYDNLPLTKNTTAGTEAALDAIARTNNAKGRAGVCPNCRGLPVRVGHQRGTSPQTLALGLLYASSLGVTAALVGHLPEGRVRILDAALRSSAQRNMLTLFPRDGEQQKTPFIRFDSEVARVVGTVTQLNGSTMSTGSFVATDPCQTVENTPTIMAAAPICSRRGPAVALGIAGLTASVARNNASLNRFTAFELGATLTHTTDRIAVTPSTSIDWTPVQTSDILRLNAARAVTSVSERLLPAEIDLESPRWYDTIALDSLSLSLPIVGRVSALHADKFDVFVELAKGPSSTNSDFTVVSSQLALPATVPLGSGSTLATVGLRRWYQSLEASSLSSKDTGMIATMRIRVVAHYERTSSRLAADIESDVQRQLVIVTDQSLLPGFPYELDAAPTPPKLVDLDGDGAREIVVGTLDGRLLALNVTDDGPLDSFTNTVYTRLLPSYQKLPGSNSVNTTDTTPPMFGGNAPISIHLGSEPIVGPVAATDLNGDGHPEIIFAGKTGRVYVLDRNGTPLAGWPRCLQSNTSNVDCVAPGTNTDDHSAPPVLADLDGDGRLEIVVAAKDGNVYAFETNGKNVKNWPIRPETNEALSPSAFTSSPAVADMDGDQIDDLVLTVGEPRDPTRVDKSRAITLLGAATPRLATVAPRWPVAVTSYDLLVDEQNRQSPATAVDAETSVPRALLYGNATRPFFIPLETGGVASGSERPRHAEPTQDNGTQGFSLDDPGADSTITDNPGLAPLFARPTLADLDRDGTTDVILPVATAGTLYALSSTDSDEHRALLAFWNGKTGKMLPASPIPLDDLVGTATPAVADLTNDGYPEMILSAGSGTIVAYDACGRSPEGWPKVVGGTVSQSPAIGDINGDGKLEVVVVTDDGRVFAWKTEADENSYVPWESALHDNSNQSTHHIPTGTVPPFPGPLSLTVSGHCRTSEPLPPEPEPTTKLSARGGCSCELPRRSTTTPLRHALSLFALGTALALRRLLTRKAQSKVRRNT